MLIPEIGFFVFSCRVKLEWNLTRKAICKVMVDIVKVFIQSYCQLQPLIWRLLKVSLSGDFHSLLWMRKQQEKEKINPTLATAWTRILRYELVGLNGNENNCLSLSLARHAAKLCKWCTLYKAHFHVTRHVTLECRERFSYFTHLVRVWPKALIISGTRDPG